MSDFTLDLAKYFYHSSEEFPVLLDSVISWLGRVPIYECVELLENNFHKDVDFIDESEKYNQPYRYLLTIDCLKSFSRLVGTVEGKFIYKCFLEIEESSLEKLRWQINEISKIEKECEKLKTKQKTLDLERRKLEDKLKELVITHEEMKEEILKITSMNDIFKENN